MKKIILAILVCAMLIPFCFSANAASGNDRTGAYATVAPTIDGSIDAIWSTTDQHLLKDTTTDYIKVLWTENALYMLGYTENSSSMMFIVSEMWEDAAGWMLWTQTGGKCDGNYAVKISLSNSEVKTSYPWYAKNPGHTPHADATYAAKALGNGTCFEAYFPMKTTASSYGKYGDDIKDRVGIAAFAGTDEAKHSGIRVSGADQTNGYCYSLYGMNSLTLVANPCTHETMLDATCKTPSSCAACGYAVGEVDADNHEKGTVWKTTDTAHSKVYECCGAEAVAAEPHNWKTEYTVDSEPTCAKKGEESIHCNDCDAIKANSAREIAAKAHAFSSEFTEDVAPTCVEAGSKSKHCANCDATTEQTEIPATGHVEGTWVLVKEATCKNEGSKRHLCGKCMSEIETAPIEKLEHTLGEWVIDAEPQEGVAGKRHNTCTVCKTEITEEIPALPSSEVSEPEGGCGGSLALPSTCVFVAIILASVTFVRKRKKVG